MKQISTLLFALLFSAQLFAQFPPKVLVGYFHNWDTGSAPYVALDEVDSRYNVINVAFAVPIAGTDYDMTFAPSQESQADFIAQIQDLQAEGKKVLISIGGANISVRLDDANERAIFVSSILDIVDTYGFDGIDIDLESNSMTLTGGTIANPIDPVVINMTTAIQEIMSEYQMIYNKKMLLTMAPETANVQGGQSNFNDFWGAYLPMIDALRDSIDLLMVQLYNSGTMFGIDGNIYTSGTADFIVAMTEATIEGFNTDGGFFNGLPASKIVVGLPACPMAAGSGYIDPITVQDALFYLRGNNVQPGAYTLFNESGYPDLRGMMTWSVNWDATSTCNNADEFAQNFQSIFGIIISTDEPELDDIQMYPNPASEYTRLNFGSVLQNVAIRITSVNGRTVWAEEHDAMTVIDINLFDFAPGFYFVNVMSNGESKTLKLVKQ